MSIDNTPAAPSFDPAKHFIRVKGGQDYLPVAWRVVWFRIDHPDWGIVTVPVEINLEKQYAIFAASIIDSEGRTVATGTKAENVRGFADFIEKAETGAVGRALANCGYGTQFAPDMEDGQAGENEDRGGNSAPTNYATGRSNGAAAGGDATNEMAICHCGKPLNLARTNYCRKNGISPCCPGQCEQMVAKPR